MDKELKLEGITFSVDKDKDIDIEMEIDAYEGCSQFLTRDEVIELIGFLAAYIGETS